MPTLQLQVNGEPRLLNPAPANLAEVVAQLGHHPRLVVVEFNGLILTPDRWDSQTVRDGDTVEIVTIVGGGS